MCTPPVCLRTVLQGTATMTHGWGCTMLILGRWSSWCWRCQPQASPLLPFCTSIGESLWHPPPLYPVPMVPRRCSSSEPPGCLCGCILDEVAQFDFYAVGCVQGCGEGFSRLRRSHSAAHSLCVGTLGPGTCPHPRRYDGGPMMNACCAMSSRCFAVTTDGHILGFCGFTNPCRRPGECP